MSSEERGNADLTSASSRRPVWVRVFVYLFLILLIIAVLAPLAFQTGQLNLPKF